MQPILDDLQDKCQRHMNCDLIPFRLLTIFNGAPVCLNPVGSQKAREWANLINGGQFSGAVRWERWRMKLKRQMKDNIACLVFKKIATSYSLEFYSHFIMTILNVCAILTEKQNKTKTVLTRLDKSNFIKLWYLLSLSFRSSSSQQ